MALPETIKAWRAGCLICIGMLLGPALVAAGLPEVEKLFRTGDYTNTVAEAERALAAGSGDADWPLLRIRGLWTLGRYEDAYGSLTNALRKHPRNLRLRWLARDVYRATGRTNAAADVVTEIRNMVSGRPWGFREPADLVIFGRVALLIGADPKDVLERLFEPATKADPNLRDAYQARGDLALDKHDFALAAKVFTEAAKKFPDDPDFQCGLAMAHAEGDRGAMIEAVEAALRINPRHVRTLLVLVDHQIDAENYGGAEKLLETVASVNPRHPELWAYRSILAILRNDASAGASARARALKDWAGNPRVDHLIGLKLSQKYRFAEGAAHQRSALAMDPGYLPAQAQLASDLLRLGDEAEGWQLAQDVHERDGYDIAAFNLATLHDAMEKFATVTNGDFVIRMSPREAPVYSARVLDLLGRAQRVLCAKYGADIQKPTIVEIFSSQKDFGVRTFGMPENPGYLGVCFGRVVTANSPAANPGSAVNWESVLWHEFCHVVTLQLTRNRMPRWLSEGISVFEELQENPSWGQRLTPEYREMILKGELTPVSRLSAAFLTPKSDRHLQFAYFQSCMVVDYIVGRYGLDRLKGILKDLREGLFINDAIARNTAAIESFEKEFDAHARKRALDLAPGLDWEKPDDGLFKLVGGVDLVAWGKDRPTNYWALLSRGRKWVEEKQWRAAIEPLEKLVELYPGQTGAGSAYPWLAVAYREAGETNREIQLLRRFAALDDGATQAYLRLMEWGGAAGDWDTVITNGLRYLAVNPLVPAPYRSLAQAYEKTGAATKAIDAHRTLLQLDPPNPAAIHFDLARLLQHQNPEAARRHAIESLEDAPRNRAALRLLQSLSPRPGATNRPASGGGRTPGPEPR